MPIGTSGIINTKKVNNSLPVFEMLFSRKLTTTSLVSNIVVALNVDNDLEVTKTFIVTLNDVTNAGADLKGNKYLELWEGNFVYQGEIVNVVDSDITVAVPIGLPFTTAATAYIVDVNQNRDFTIAGIGQQEYTIAPGPAFIGNIQQIRFMFQMLHDAEADASTYGDISGGLTNGVILEGKGKLFTFETGLPADLVLYNGFLNIKTNGDYELTAFDVAYIPKSGNPASPENYGTRIRKTFNGPDKSDTIIEILSSRDSITCVILRDDLDDLVRHRIKSVGRLGFF